MIHSPYLRYGSGPLRRLVSAPGAGGRSLKQAGALYLLPVSPVYYRLDRCDVQDEVAVSDDDHMTVDQWSTEPIYRQLAEILRAKIASGEYGPGDKLPSEPRLQQEHGHARDTIRHAIKLLREENLVVTLPGRGTFVRPTSG